MDIYYRNLLGNENIEIKKLTHPIEEKKIVRPIVSEKPM